MTSEAFSHLGQTDEGKDIKISAVIPTYNEKENLLQFIDELKYRARLILARKVYACAYPRNVIISNFCIN